METVRVLAAAGARVIMTSRSAEAGQKVARQLMQSDLKVHFAHNLQPDGLPMHSSCSMLQQS